MKRYLLFWALLFLSCVSAAQGSIDTSSYLIFDPQRNAWQDYSMYMGFDTTVQEMPAQIMLDTMTEQAFFKYKKSYRSKISFPKSGMTQTDTTIVIHTDQHDIVLKANERSYDEFSYYKGFIKPLNLFVYNKIDGKNGLGVMVFVDKKTGKQFLWESGYDAPCETALLSPKNHFVMAYANSLYENGQCNVMVMKVVPKGKTHYKMQAYASAEWEGYTMTEAFWIDEKSMAICLVPSTQLDDEGIPMVEQYYLKATLQSGGE